MRPATTRRFLRVDYSPTLFPVPNPHDPISWHVVSIAQNPPLMPRPLRGTADVRAGWLPPPFEDFAADDHGALFDVQFPAIDPGESMTFTLFYGVGARSATPKDALRLVAVEVWSRAEPDATDGATTGGPNTFAFGLRFDGPNPALPQGLVPGATTQGAARYDGDAPPVGRMAPWPIAAASSPHWCSPDRSLVVRGARRATTARPC